MPIRTMSTENQKPAQSIPVYHASELTVVNGANLGDSLSFAAELDLDDTYELRANARLRRLSLSPQDNGTFLIASETALGRPGATLHLDCCITMMSTTGQTAEILVLVEVDAAGLIENVYALPLAPLTPRLAYSLVGIDRDSAHQRFAQVA